MWTRLILLCFFIGFLRSAGAICTVSKYEDGPGDWVKCSNSNLAEALAQGNNLPVTALTISRSSIPIVPGYAFMKHAGLQSLTLQNCATRELNEYAFSRLTLLKKLSLPNNNISAVLPGWFSDLTNLEQLDLSFNQIRNIDSRVFAKLTNIRRFNLDDNLLKCLDPLHMLPMRSIAKIRVMKNPLNFICRGKMSQWFNDKGINYLSGVPGVSGSWLDRVLWLCAEDVSGSLRDEETMRECLFFNVFNQLKLALETTSTYKNSAQQCPAERNHFLKCIANSGPSSITNGRAITRIALALRDAAKTYKIPSY